MKKRMKSITALMMVMGLGGASLTGLAAGDEATLVPAPRETVKEGAKDSEESITLMASQNWIKDVYRELFKKFEKETGTEVKVLLTPDNGYSTLLGTTLSGGSNAVDMFMFAAGSEAVSAGLPEAALDLSGEEWVSNMEDWAKKANSYKDKVIGFSTWGIDYEGILYNKTYFEENKLEVPKTWDEFMALCEKIKSLGVTPLYEGINGVWHTQSWAYSLTPQMYKEKPDFVEYLNKSKDNKFADIKSFKDGMTQVADLLAKKDYYTNDGQSEDWFGSYTSLQSRETVMMFTYSAYPAELAANGSKDTWGMFPVPLLDNQQTFGNGGGISKYINKNSDKTDTCKELLKFLAKEENLETYYAARTDLVTASFKNVKSVKPTEATKEILSIHKGDIQTNFVKDVLYWDTNIYEYMQGLAEGSTTVDEFITNVDDFRATMFDTAE